MRLDLLGLACGIALLASCSDRNDPTDIADTIDLTADQSDGLAAALSYGGDLDGALGPDAPGFVPFAFRQVRRAGTMGAYHAVVVQISYDYTFTHVHERHTGIVSSVVGWQDLDGSAPRPDKLIVASQFSNGATFPGTASATFDDGVSRGWYFDRATTSKYRATSGTFDLTGATFSGTPKACAYHFSFPSASCTYSVGTMTGTVGFTASKTTGGGTDAFTQPSTSFELPAIRVTLAYECECYPDE